MNSLTGKVISRRKDTWILITQEFIDRVKALTKKYGIKPPPIFKDRKERTIRKDDDESNGDNGSISGLDDEDEKI